ncbi:hypothetical protein GCM10010975_09350 [Comamonas phosphati]|nr:hypothetical protein GCM10010975_09350 [Comamonas phosphati]
MAAAIVRAQPTGLVLAAEKGRESMLAMIVPAIHAAGTGHGAAGKMMGPRSVFNTTYANQARARRSPGRLALGAFLFA